MFITIPISGLFIIKFLIPIYRTEGSVSAYGYIEKRFGTWASLYCVICYTVTNLFRLGIIIYLMAFGIRFLTGYTEQSIILIISGVVILYTVFGGLKCVIWTDFFQAILFFSGTLLVLFLICVSLPCNLQDAFVYAHENGKFSFGNMDFSLLKPTIWVLIINGLMANFQGLGTEQSFVQRYIAAKSERCAKKSLFVASSLIFVFSIILFFIGTLLFVYYKQSQDNNLIIHFVSNENILLKFIAEKVPIGLKGVVIIAIIAAAMSSISSELNAITTLVFKHVYTRFFSKTLSSKKTLRILYTISAIIGIVPIIISFGFIQKTNLLEIWNRFDSLISGGIIGLFLLALLVKTTKSKSVLFSIMLCYLIVFWSIFSHSWQSYLSQKFKSPLDSNINIALSLLVILSIVYGTYRIFKKVR